MSTSPIDAVISSNLELFRKPGALSVRAGYKVVGGRPTRKPAIVVTVEHKSDAVPPADRLPESVDGYSVDVREASPLKQLELTDPDGYDAVISSIPPEQGVARFADEQQRPRRKRLSWESRCEIVARIEAGMSPPLAAASGGASRSTGYRLWRRYQQGGWAGLQDRPSIPRRQPRRLSVEAEQAIVAARRRSAYGPVRLAALVPYPPSTIGKVLRRHGCSRLPRPEGAARCARRYERDRPGELLHIDTKRLGRFWEPGKRVLGEQAGRPHKNRRAGWQHLHVAIDDHSRLAYAELLAGQDAVSCVRFLDRALDWYRAHGVHVERVLTDNAKADHSQAWIESTAEARIERRYTRIYRPRTNGKAERLIQTMLREWAYSRTYPSSSQRARALPGYLRRYNRHRPHSSIGARPPISRVSHLCSRHS